MECLRFLVQSRAVPLGIGCETDVEGLRRWRPRRGPFLLKIRKRTRGAVHSPYALDEGEVLKAAFPYVIFALVALGAALWAHSPSEGSRAGSPASSVEASAPLLGDALR